MKTYRVVFLDESYGLIEANNRWHAIQVAEEAWPGRMWLSIEEDVDAK